MLSQRVRSTLVVFAFVLAFSASIWTSHVDAQGSLPTEAQQVGATVLHEDFEDDAVGPLGAPWSITKVGTSQASIVAGRDAHGKVLLLRGGKAADYLIGSRSISSSSTEIIVQVDIKPASDASFIWSLHGAGTSIGRRRIRLQREPGSTMLVSHTVPGGSRNCAPLPSGVWSTVTLKVHVAAYPHTFDVLINGNPTACTALSTGLSKPFTHVNVMDASNEGWGGDVRFDNIDITTPSVQSSGAPDQGAAAEDNAPDDGPVEEPEELPVKLFIPQITR